MRIMFCSLLMLTAFVSTAAQKPTANPPPPNPQPSTPVVYVLGRVRAPAAIPFTASTTVLRAIEQAGGALPNEKNSIARIYRRTAGCENATQIKVALKDIRSGRAQDISLQSGDIVEVVLRKRGRFDSSGLLPCNLPLPTRIIY